MGGPCEILRIPALSSLNMSLSREHCETTEATSPAVTVARSDRSRAHMELPCQMQGSRIHSSRPQDTWHEPNLSSQT